MPAKAQAALEAGQPPDFLFGTDRELFRTANGPTRTGSSTSRTRSCRSRACSTRTRSPPPPCSTRPPADAPSTRCRWGSRSNHVHVWSSLLEQAGFTLDDIPKEWEAFWSFWCDQVQPAVRKATGRDDIWGVGLPMSAEADDTRIQFEQFMQAYEANYVTREGRLVIDDPRDPAQADQGHGQLHGDLPQGLHAARLGRAGTMRGNNQAFLAQTVVMTVNTRSRFRMR